MEKILRRMGNRVSGWTLWRKFSGEWGTELQAGRYGENSQEIGEPSFRLDAMEKILRRMGNRVSGWTLWTKFS
jgi:hypothetical protein